MAKYCPILKRKVVYLQCIDCEDKKECENIEDDYKINNDDETNK